MSKKFLSSIKNAQGSSLPISGSSGEQFFNTTDNKLYTHDGTSWGLAGATGADGSSGFVQQTSAPSSTNVLWLDTDETGIGVPVGGTSGQTLTKIDNTDFNAEWTSTLKNTNITTASSSTVPLTVQGVTSQSANLQEWKNSSGTAVSYTDQYGGHFAVSEGTYSKFYASNPTPGTDQYVTAFQVGNDTGTKVVHFLNSSTRSTDGGTNAYTIRNDGGMLNLGNSSYKTNISGVVTMPQQPVYGGSLNGVGSTSNYYPVASDNFVVGFSRSGNNRLTAQVAGKYYVSAQQLISSSGGVYFNIFKNGTTIVYAYSDNDSTYDVTVATLVDLQVNDYIELYYNNTVSSSWGSIHSAYTVFKVS